MEAEKMQEKIDDINKTRDKVIEMSKEQFQKAMAQGTPSAGPLNNPAISARLDRLVKGQEKPLNEFVEYMLDQFRANAVEYRTVQANIQELTRKLNQLNNRAIQLQGEQNKYVQDILAWWDRGTKTKAGEAGKGESK